MFITLKFVHVAFMFIGVALAVGPASMVFLSSRSAEPLAVRRACELAERLFRISTACYGLGIVFGFAAALSGALDLGARWLTTAYALVALLGIHGILFERWTKRLGRAASGSENTASTMAFPVDTRVPTYLIGAMFVLIVVIVYVMVTKPTFF